MSKRKNEKQKNMSFLDMFKELKVSNMILTKKNVIYLKKITAKKK
jgi:hypothetical protein